MHRNADSDILSSFEATQGGAEDVSAIVTDKTCANDDSWGDDFWDDWLGRPLDPLVAPFGIDPTPSAAGLTSDSLDFLWKLRV